MIPVKELRSAAKECEKLILDSLPDPDECKAEFSRRFERRMKKLVLRTDHPFRYWIQKSVACFLLIIFLGGGSLLTFSTEVRAAFFGWVREVCETYFSYHYVGENQNALEGVVYRPTWVPDGYEVISESHDIAGGDIIYQSENEEIIAFSWFRDAESSVFQIESETAEIQNTFVGNCPADLYIEHSDSLSNALVWSDQEEKTFFTFTAPLSEDSLIKMAESVAVENIK